MGKTAAAATTSTEEAEETAEVEAEETEETAEVEAEEVDEDADDDAEAAVIATFTPAQAALWTKQTDALTKANANARSKRLALKALRTGQQAPAGPKPTAPKVPAKTGEGAPAFDPEAFKASLLAEMRTTQQADQVQSKAERALKNAGLVLPEGEAGERKLARVMRMVDWTGVTPDEVADEIDDLKADNPELFKAVKRRPKTGGVSGPGAIKPAVKGGREAELFD